MSDSLKESTWDTTKENVQPLRSGRKADFLKVGLHCSVEQNRHLIEERQKFEEEILAGENSSDPLDSWDKYLKWTQQNFLIGENKKTYESVLRKFVVKFLKSVEYKNDPRYINAWITMARISENPEDIFSYMKCEGLGSKCAAFYIAWAEELEKYCSYKKASEIYQLGEENNAEPVALLLKMRNAFQMRSARDAVNNIELKRLESSSNSPKPIQPQRKALKNVAQKKTLPFSATAPNPTRNENSSLVIFNDDDVDSKAPAKEGKWADMPDHYKANKENSVQKAKPWSGSVVQQKHRFTSALQTPAASTPSFSIFQDVTAKSIPATPARKVSKTVEKVLVESKSSKNTEQPLQKMLLECNEESNSKTSRQYPFDKIYSVMGEFQLEEIIAASRRKSKRSIEQAGSN